MKFLIGTFVSWLPLGVAITGLCMLMHVTVQQNYRQSLNDPQIQMAEDGVAALGRGAVPASLIPKGEQIDISKSLAPWIAVYDFSATPLESSAVLAGALPKPPKGVFDATDPSNYDAKGGGPSGENRVTWQPYEGVRQAIVIVRAQRYFVVAGRNMREVENREGDLGTMIILAWLAIMVATFVTNTFAQYVNFKKD